MIVLRPETEGDLVAIREINVSAFGRPQEADLIEAIRRSAAFIPKLSLVAIAGERALGHVLFSAVRIRTSERIVPALALAPLAVRPEAQRQGVGTRLTEHGLREARRLGHRIAIVIGHHTYYPRFGFSPARAQGLEAPFPVSDAAFMALALVPGALEGVRGMVEYPPAFGIV